MRLWQVANAHKLLAASVVAQPGEICRGLDLGAVGRRRAVGLGLAESIPRHAGGTGGAVERGALETGARVNAVHPGGVCREDPLCLLVFSEQRAQPFVRGGVRRHGQRAAATDAIGGGVRVNHRVIEQDKRTVAPGNTVKYIV